MCHYACNSKVGTTTQSRQRNLDVSSWMHSRNKVCMCVCEQDTDSENSFNASMLLDLCTMRFQSVCLWAKTGWLRERLQPRRRCINSGVMEADSIHTHTQSPPPPSNLSRQMRQVLRQVHTAAVPQHHFSSHSSICSMGHLFVHSGFEKKKKKVFIFLYTPSLTFTYFQG